MKRFQFFLDYFRESRKHFNIDEWIDLLVSSCQFNPDVHRLSQKLLLLSRIIPLVEPRVNLTLGINRLPLYESDGIFKELAGRLTGIRLYRSNPRIDRRMVYAACIPEHPIKITWIQGRFL